MKLNRKYRLAIQANDGDWIVIVPPITIKLNAQRSVSASLNTLNIDIHNLGEKTRNRIFQDKFVTLTYRRIILQAGYGDTLFSVFVGNVFTANSLRQKTEIITRIVAQDGGYDINGTQSFRSMPPGTTLEAFSKALIGDFENINLGAISSFTKSFPRGIVVNKNTFFLINKYTDGRAFCDTETVHILGENDAISGSGFIPVINADTGLLGAPLRRNASLSVKVIFSPDLVIGQLVDIESHFNKSYNGRYKINGLQHVGVISESMPDACISIFELFVGDQVFGQFNEISA